MDIFVYLYLIGLIAPPLALWLIKSMSEVIEQSNINIKEIILNPLAQYGKPI